MIKLAHISPYCYMEEAEAQSDINLVLAHLVGNKHYTNFYLDSEKYTIMDNSAFELGESFEPARLIELGKKIKADCLVLPDYPKKDWKITVEAAEKYVDLFKSEGFDVMFVPQSLAGDFEGYMNGLSWALNNPKIDLIGLSILGAPNALPLMDRNKTRAYILKAVEERFGLLMYPDKFHMLGKLDSVDEITSWKPYEYAINSHDTSAAVWYGMNSLSVQNRTKKFEVPVDFEAYLEYDETLIRENISYMKGLSS